jgi:hypothetical protein
MEGVLIHEVDTSNMKPHITRITLSRHRIRWVILMNDGIIGFKKQTQFKHFNTACFIASCINSL